MSQATDNQRASFRIYALEQQASRNSKENLMRKLRAIICRTYN
jgi:hypothetical protein